MKELLTIILVNYNTKQLLRNCIVSIYDRIKGVSLEIIVVDNNSTDGSSEMVKFDYPNVILVVNKANQGFAFANNQGIKIAKGNYILLLNSDTYFIDGSLENAVNYFANNSDVGILGIKLINKDHSLQPSCFQFPTIWNLFVEAVFLYKLFPKTRLFGSYYMTWFKFDSLMDVDYMTGAFLLIRRSVFEAIGYLDEDYFMYSEEVDFCYRAKQKNIRRVFYPNASVVHLGGGSVTQQYARLFQLHSTQFHYFKKNYSSCDALIMTTLKWFGVLLRVGVYGAIGIVTLNKKMIKKSSNYLKLSISVYIAK